MRSVAAVGMVGLKESATGKNVTVNITFPYLTIREEADIARIARVIDRYFQDDYYAVGGM
jgi:hypothetical protein